MKWLERIAVAPFLLLFGAGLVAVSVLLYRFVLEAPLQNGLIGAFAVWMTFGFLYLLMTRDR
jgi:Na+/glutamate symporter